MKKMVLAKVATSSILKNKMRTLLTMLGIIIGVAAVMLAWAFWRVYRPQPVCHDGSCPADPSVWLKAMLWVAALMTVLAFFADDLQWILVDATPEGLR